MTIVGWLRIRPCHGRRCHAFETLHCTISLCAAYLSNIDHFWHGWLRRYLMLHQGFEPFHIQLAQQLAEGPVQRWFGDVGAE
jgi:hypothetical protein